MLLLKINQIKKISQYTEALTRKYKKKKENFYLPYWREM